MKKAWDTILEYFAMWVIILAFAWPEIAAAILVSFVVLCGVLLNFF